MVYWRWLQINEVSIPNRHVKFQISSWLLEINLPLGLNKFDHVLMFDLSFLGGIKVICNETHSEPMMLKQGNVVKYARCSALWNAGMGCTFIQMMMRPHMCVVPSQSVCPSLQSTEKFKLLYHTRASSCNRHKNWLKNIVSFDANLTQTSEQKVQLHQNISLQPIV